MMQLGRHAAAEYAHVLKGIDRRGALRLGLSISLRQRRAVEFLDVGELRGRLETDVQCVRFCRRDGQGQLTAIAGAGGVERSGILQAGCVMACAVRSHAAGAQRSASRNAGQCGRGSSKEQQARDDS